MNRDIAVIGMAGVFPGARDLDEFWANNVNRVDAVTEVPEHRWDSSLFASLPEGHEARILCSQGGFLPRDIGFDPRRYGIMPNVMQDADPDQFLMTHVADAALRDAGVDPDAPIRQRTDMIVGRGGYLSPKMAEVFLRIDLVYRLMPFLRARFPEMSPEALDDLQRQLNATLPPHQPDSLSTCIPNLVASRVSNRLDLGGVAYVVDAACASSLIAVEQAAARLRNGQCDLALASGIHLCQVPPFWFVFTHLKALSTSGVVRPFDRRADGLLLGEGAGIVVLKRLEDAVRNGDCIYAVIKGVGSGSDARQTGVLLPSTGGEIRALRCAYADAAVDPATISYLEAHGTGTVVGDQTEIETIRAFFGGASIPTRPMGSVKSMIGHAMPAAGIASLIRTVLALSHKVIPPTLHCEQPHPALRESRFYVATETRPWVHPRGGPPRRAGVSAFGFGGINAHVVLEELRLDGDFGVGDFGISISPNPQVPKSPNPQIPEPERHPSASRNGGAPGGPPIANARPIRPARKQPTEIALFSAGSRAGLLGQLQQLEDFLALDRSGCQLADVCSSLVPLVDFSQPWKLALVCEDLRQLRQVVADCLAKLQAGAAPAAVRGNVFFSAAAADPHGKVAVLFPGLVLPSPRWHIEDAPAGHRNGTEASFPAIGSALPSRPEWPAGLVANDPGNWIEMAIHFPELRQELDKFEGKDENPEDAVPLSCILSPPGSLPGALRDRLRRRVAPPEAAGDREATRDVAPSARNLWGIGVMLSNRVGWRLLQALEIKPQMLSGQGYADLAALAAAGTLDFDSDVLPNIWRTLTDPSCYPAGGRLAFAGVGPQQLQPYLQQRPEVRIAVYVSPAQVLFGGRAEQVDQIVSQLRRQGDVAVVLPYVLGPARWMDRLGGGEVEGAEQVELRPPRLPVYSAVSAAPFPDQADGIRELLAASLDHPIRLWETNRRMYADGARIFIQAGYAGLAGTVAALASVGHLRCPTDGPAEEDVVSGEVDQSARPPITQLNRLLGALFSAGVRFNPSALYRHRSLRVLEFERPQVQPPARPVGKAPAYPLDGWQRRSACPPDERSNDVELSFGWLAPQPGLGSAAAAAAARVADRPTGAAAVSRLPFAGQVLRFVPARRIVLKRRLDLREDLYLEDHCFVGAAPYKPLEECLPVFPMVMMIELAAETAAQLAPGLGLVGVEEVKALRWIRLEDATAIDVRVEASGPSLDRSTGVQRVAVRVFLAGETCASATVLFGPQYRQDIQLAFSSLGPRRSWPYTAEELYRERHTFHGPRFQTVSGFDQLGEQGLTGRLRVLAKDHLFASVPDPQLLTDPVVIDGVGQLLGCWTQAHGRYVLPVGIDKLEIYRPAPKPGTEVPVRVQVTRFDARSPSLSADAEVQDGEGFVWMRIRGWSDVVLPSSRRVMEAQRRPDRYCIAESQELPPASDGHLQRPEVASPPGLDVQNAAAGHQRGMEVPLPAASGPLDAVSTVVPYEQLTQGSLDWIARLYLTADELKVLKEMRGRRKRQHLAGRIAAKDAVRLWLSQQTGESLLHPAAVAIVADAAGKPVLRAPPGLSRPPQISISHTDDRAVAVAAASAVGIDVEPISRNTQEILDQFASAEEVRFLAARMRDPSDPTWPTRLWCAKEAAGKAIGSGLSGRPKDFQLVQAEPDGSMRIRHRESGRQWTAFTWHRQGVLMAIAVAADSQTQNNGLGPGPSSP